MKTIVHIVVLASMVAAVNSVCFASPPDQQETSKSQAQIARNTTSNSSSSEEKKFATSNDRATSKEIITQIVREDTELAVQARRFKILTVNGHVTISGKVKSEKQREKIGSIASNVVGQTNVDNLLVVK
ncbi:BON domain-containing protein [Pedosphaera parvula]|uniref:Transport-associated protein n=1 Tax=Pedosphaera parvula (strain Ellin514) TaxID=320771 RepID=B9XMQ3_PEDPL|nr:BON domain-containing protein [Pedosphaera parvula]EEF58828.1 transport-associated protein [Pedosphaera parvula Ellin514]